MSSTTALKELDMTKDEWMKIEAGKWTPIMMPNKIRLSILRLGPLVVALPESDDEKFLFGDLNMVAHDYDPPTMSPIPYRIVHVQITHQRREAKKFVVEYAGRIKKVACDTNRDVVRDSTIVS